MNELVKMKLETFPQQSRTSDQTLRKLQKSVIYIWKCKTATYGRDDWKTDHSTERVVRYEPTAGGDRPEDSGQEP